MSWKNLSFKSKLVFIILLNCGISLLVACGIFFAYETKSYKNIMAENLASLSKIVGANVASAIVFEDREDAESVLSALSSERNIVECIVVDRQGKEFARYQRPQGPVPDKTAPDNHKDLMSTDRDIILKDEVIGRVHICSDFQLLRERLKQYAITTITIVIGSLLAGLLLALRLQRVISDPVSRLINASHHISNNRDYSIRVTQSESKDEIATLVATFNQMLDNIQERDKSLQAARDNLEVKVEERTRKLREEMTERIKAQQSIEAEKEKVKQYLDIMGGILVALDAYGRIILINRKGCEILGQAETDLIGQEWFDSAVPPGQREEVRTIFSRIISGDTDSCLEYNENTVITKTGTKRLIAWNNTLIRNAAGKITGTLSSGMDITERRQAEESLRETNIKLGNALEQLKHAQEQIIQSERLKALGEMASGIAHDFNNALMPMMGYTNFILHNPKVLDDKEDTMSMIKDVNLAARDAMEVVRRLREFYKPSMDSEMEMLNLNTILESAIGMTRPKWKDEMERKGTPVEINRAFKEIPPVMANESKIRETIINLILNAADSMPKGGSISVSTSKEKHWVVAEIRDTGTGMDQHVLQRCFDPFFTTKGGKGTGLGLSIVHGIIRQHNGQIDITSTQGKGTNVKIRLPEAKSQKAVPPNSTEPFKDLPDRKIHILIVDDEKTNLKIMEKFLTKKGITTKSALDGIEGLELFKNESFDLIITDRSMPGMNGDILAKKIRAINAGVPIIMLTGYADLMEANQEMPQGVTLIVKKPVTDQSLFNAITQALTSA